ncbi:MAG TPA: phosphate-starvation-inducible PsiE family protein [Ktedonobacterales bacterium]|nr:phosphate-starvation-inducible PsiE family protein [Ktedonobacterales bacterium]
MNPQEPDQAADQGARLPPDDRRGGAQREQRPLWPPLGRVARWLDGGGSLLQAMVGLLLFLAALFTIGYAIYDFASQLASHEAFVAGPGQPVHLSEPQNIAEAIIALVGDLLLVLIILEVLTTVLHYLREHTVSLKPFLFIGIISAVRELLVVSARLAVIHVSGDELWQLLAGLGVSTGIILGLGITLRLLTREAGTDTL